MKRSAWPLLALLFLAILALYLPTLQRDVNGSSASFMIDVGEIQGALATWGTLHPSGYPLYTILGNAIVAAGRLLGLSPATGAALFSLLSSLCGLALVYLLALRIGRSPPVAAAATLAMAVANSYWLNSVIAEVYAFNFLLTMGSLTLAYEIRRQGRWQLLPWLALLWGAAISHHRTALLLAPALALLTWPGRSRLTTKTTTLSVAALLLPFAAYAYMPLRAAAGAVWVYGQPDTWSDFWYIFFSREYRPFIQAPDLPAALQRTWETLSLARTELGVVNLLGVTGLLVGLRKTKTRAVAAACLLVILAFLGFSLIYTVPDKVSMLLPLLAVLLLGWTFLAAALPAHWRPWPSVVIALLVLLPVLPRVPQTRADVVALSRDPGGRQLIAAAKAIEDDNPRLISRWGRDWFAYRYAKYATGELSAAQILPPHSDPRPLWEQGHDVYVGDLFFFQESLDEWQEEYGPLYLRSAAPSVIQLLDAPRREPDLSVRGSPTPMGEAIRLLGYRRHVTPQNNLQLTLYWQSVSTPPADYSVFVHLVSHVLPRGPDDVITQADRRHPVHGWYPTSQWTAEEVVRDDYLVPIPPESAPQAVIAGLYTQNEAGAFQNLGAMTIPLEETIAQ